MSRSDLIKLLLSQKYHLQGRNLRFKTMKGRWASLISGSGTTMAEMVKAIQSGEIPMDVACIIASTPEAAGIEKARSLGIPAGDIVVVDPNDFRGEDKKVDQYGFGMAILKELKARGVTVITQNGWLPLTPEVVIQDFPQTSFNQHPGPLPDFGGNGMYGRRVHAAVLIFRRFTRTEPWTEATAQRIDINFDKGGVVGAQKVEISPDDTVEDLQRRVLPIEHHLQIQLLKDVAAGNIKEIAKKSFVADKHQDALKLAKRVACTLYPYG